MKLRFVVNGEELALEPCACTIRQVARAALRLSGNLARPLEEWELRSDQGHLLDLDASIYEAPQDLFLTLRLGVGGSVARVGQVWTHLGGARDTTPARGPCVVIRPNDSREAGPDSWQMFSLVERRTLYMHGDARARGEWR